MSNYLEDIFSLKGKVAVVTGASRGIGAAIANALANAGANTFGVGRSQKQSGTIEDVFDYRTCNVTDHNDFSIVCENIFNAAGRIDILINAAGISLSNTSDSNVIQSFSETLNTNLAAVYNSCLVVSRFMKATDCGSIVNISSIGSVLGFPNNPAYVASKGGVRMLTKALAIDFAKYNIRVNSLAPGYIRTSMTEDSFSNNLLHLERLQHMIIKRWGIPEDLAGAAIFLASDASAYVTGIDLFVDGGWTAKGL